MPLGEEAEADDSAAGCGEETLAEAGPRMQLSRVVLTGVAPL